MSLLEKFFKKQKEPVSAYDTNKYYAAHMEKSSPKVIHAQQVLEDGRLYSTEKAEKIFEHDRRVYFITPKQNMFSAGYRQYTRTFMTAGKLKAIVDQVEYTGLRIEQKNTVKQIVGKIDIELYEKYFGEPEEG